MGITTKNWKLSPVKRYRQSFLINCIAISIPGISGFTPSIVALSMSGLLVWGGVLCLWWFGYYYLLKSVRGSFTFSFILNSLVWLVLLIQIIRRIVFVMQNGGMERADGYGSPVAFLLGVITEMLFFLPLSFTEVLGFAVLLRKRQEQLSSKSETCS